jgi:hypothetical protein
VVFYAAVHLNATEADTKTVHLLEQAALEQSVRKPIVIPDSVTGVRIFFECASSQKKLSSRAGAQARVGGGVFKSTNQVG